MTQNEPVDVQAYYKLDNHSETQKLVGKLSMKMQVGNIKGNGKTFNQTLDKQNVPNYPNINSVQTKVMLNNLGENNKVNN